MRIDGQVGKAEIARLKEWLDKAFIPWIEFSAEVQDGIDEQPKEQKADNGTND